MRIGSHSSVNMIFWWQSTLGHLQDVTNGVPTEHVCQNEYILWLRLNGIIESGSNQPSLDRSKKSNGKSVINTISLCLHNGNFAFNLAKNIVAQNSWYRSLFLHLSEPRLSTQGWDFGLKFNQGQNCIPSSHLIITIVHACRLSCRSYLMDIGIQAFSSCI